MQSKLRNKATRQCIRIHLHILWWMACHQPLILYDIISYCIILYYILYYMMLYFMIWYYILLYDMILYLYLYYIYIICMLHLYLCIILVCLCVCHKGCCRDSSGPWMLQTETNQKTKWQSAQNPLCNPGALCRFHFDFDGDRHFGWQMHPTPYGAGVLICDKWRKNHPKIVRWNSKWNSKWLFQRVSKGDIKTYQNCRI